MTPFVSFTLSCFGRGVNTGKNMSVTIVVVPEFSTETGIISSTSVSGCHRSGHGFHMVPQSSGPLDAVGKFLRV